MILVTTAGKVGFEAARLLAARGEHVRVLLRDPNSAKGRALARSGVEVFEADLLQKNTIDRAMSDVTSVILVSPAIPIQEMNVIASAQMKDVGHIVKISSKSSLDSPISRRRDQALIEESLQAAGVGFTILRNNAYMQNFLMMAQDISETDAFRSSAGDGRVGMVDVGDVAAAAVEISLAPERHTNRTYWLSGPTALTYEEAATALSHALNRVIQYRAISFEEEQQLMIAAGMPEELAETNARAIALFAQGDSDWVSGDVPTLLGRPARTFEDFVLNNIAAFV